MTANTDPSPSTPLLKAILLEDPVHSVAQVNALLEAGEDPNVPDDQFYNERPLYAAWSESNIPGKEGMVKLMLDHGAIADHSKNHLVDIYMVTAPIETTQLIFEAGHSFKEYIAIDEDEQTIKDGGSNPLTYLLDQDRFDLIENLQKYDILELINVFEIPTGWSPLNEMARDGEVEKCKWLIEHGADVNGNCDRWVGDTPLDYAVIETKLEVVKLLLDAGANPNIPTWMKITATSRAQEIAGNTDSNPSNRADALQIESLVLEASTRFPKPT